MKCLVCVLSLVLWSFVAQAATIRVTTTSPLVKKDRRCSLPEAVQAANTDKWVDTCARGRGVDIILLPAGTFSLRDSLVISSRLTLRGRGQDRTILQADPTTPYIRSPLVVSLLAGLQRVVVEDLTLCCTGTPEAPRPVWQHLGGLWIGNFVTMRDNPRADYAVFYPEQ
jgi:hypothetical protein